MTKELVNTTGNWYEETLQDLQDKCSHLDTILVGIDVYKCNTCGKIIDICEDEDL